MSDVRVKVRDLILRRLEKKVRGVGGGRDDSYLTVYDLHPTFTHEYETWLALATGPGPRPRTPRPRPPHDKILEQWRVTPEGTEELSSKRDVNSIIEDPTRGVIATVSLWIDVAARTAYVDWVLGPLYGRGYTHRITVDGDSVALDSPDLRWLS